MNRRTMPRKGYNVHVFGGPTDDRGRPTNPRFTDASGRVWVTRSVFGARRNPAWCALDPLTVPLWLRPSVTINAHRRREAMRRAMATTDAAAAYDAWCAVADELRIRRDAACPPRQNPRYRLERAG